MYKFTIELAEMPIEIITERESTRNRCKDYLTDKPAEFSVSISGSDMEDERKWSKSETPKEWELEWVAIYRKICSELAHRNTVLIHGSCIAVDGSAYLFCAPSGTGKSTHTRLWREYLGEKAVMVNDDKPLVRIFEPSDPAYGAERTLRIYGTPWNGKHRLGANISAPLKAVCFLGRSEENHIERIDAASALPQLIKYTFRPEDPASMLAVLDNAAKIADLSAFYSLVCNMDPKAAEVAYKGMSEG